MSAQCFPDVFTVCAVTRAMRCAEVEPGPASEQDGAGESGTFSVAIPDSLLSVSRSDLAAEQRADPSLSQLGFSGCSSGKFCFLLCAGG